MVGELAIRVEGTSMPHYIRVGDVPAKRHTVFRRADGGLHAEELMGEDGFSSGSALLYHLNPPTAISGVEPIASTSEEMHANYPLLPRHFRTADVDAGADMVTGRRLLLGNDDIRISYATCQDGGDLYRNASGDELVFIKQGSGSLQTVFGDLAFGPGDYVVIPTSTTHRWVVDEAVQALVIESSGHITPPRRYLSASGQFLEHSPYCERDLRAPVGPLIIEGDDVPVVVKHGSGVTRYIYSKHPFDVVGWDGCLYPYAFSIHDFEPITGRIHQPPPVHQTFEAPNVVICSFVPRIFDYHPDAVAVPYNHANINTDEVLFYVEGDFMSRKGAGIEAGSMSLHPAGHVHGPHPGSVEAGLGADGTEELAVMIDTFKPLALGASALAAEDEGYLSTWVLPRS